MPDRTIIIRCKSSTDGLKLLGFVGRALHTCFEDSSFTMALEDGVEYRYNSKENSKGMPVRAVVEESSGQGYLFPPIEERAPLQ